MNEKLIRGLDGVNTLLALLLILAGATIGWIAAYPDGGIVAAAVAALFGGVAGYIVASIFCGVIALLIEIEKHLKQIAGSKTESIASNQLHPLSSTTAAPPLNEAEQFHRNSDGINYKANR